MNITLGAIVFLTGIAFGAAGIVLFVLALFILCLVLFFYWSVEITKKLSLSRVTQNPILEPIPEHEWESEAVFNPAAIVDGDKVHLFYRAMGHDGISRIGYAVSGDGIHFTRSSRPVYDKGAGFSPLKTPTYAPLSYNTTLYASGGGWGGAEDPRTVIIDDKMYMNFASFEGWSSIRMTLTSLTLDDLRDKKWNWKKPFYLSPSQETNKNWVLFPEKIKGKFAILHALTPDISIAYVDSLESIANNPIKSHNHRSGRAGAWDAFVRGAAAPPIKTEAGWLLLYHGMDPAHADIGYKVGAMLLDLTDPTKILYRSADPVLVPTYWYENDWKPGVVYASGAVIFHGDLVVYYGGGDKRIAAAKANLRDFLRKLQRHEHAVLSPVKL